jgi:hypothetical protein
VGVGVGDGKIPVGSTAQCAVATPLRLMVCPPRIVATYGVIDWNCAVTVAVTVEPNVAESEQR